MNIRPLLTAALYSIGTLLVAAGIAAVWPMPGSEVLVAQTAVVQARMGPIVLRAGSPLQILVTRDSVLSVVLYDWVFPWINGTSHTKTRAAGSASAQMMGQLQGESVAQAIHPRLLGRCLVVVSARSMAPDGVLKELADDIGHAGLAWRFILTHEAAHCLRDAALNLRLSQKVVRDGLTMFAANFVTEAYADNFAVADLWSQDRDRTLELVPILLRWRDKPQMAPPWKTGPAIDLLISRLAGTGISDAIYDPVLMDRMAWQAAVDALPVHFEHMGLDVKRVDMQLIDELGEKAPMSLRTHNH